MVDRGIAARRWGYAWVLDDDIRRMEASSQMLTIAQMEEGR
jgi:hypothetical protein